ncbi:MAG: FecR family protein [Prevotella sp.]|jgi:transmembrane sensor
MEKEIKHYKYELTMEDQKLRSFVENSALKHMDITAIKQKTFQKIHEEERRVKRRRILTIVGVAASLLLLVGVGFGIMFNKTESEDVQFASTLNVQPTEVMQTLTVPVGERMTIMLADGTKVIANSRTKLVYPKSFKGDTREIMVNGEAFFDVAHDAEHPFIVKTDGFNVKVLGTRFNITNYNTSSSHVVLVQGSVELTTKSNDVVKMKPSDKVEVCNGAFTSKSQVDPNDYTCWMDGVMNLHGEGIQMIAQRLSQHYGVKIVCDVKEFTPLYGKLALQGSVYDVLNTVDTMAGIKTVKKGDTIHLVSN